VLVTKIIPRKTRILNLFPKDFFVLLQLFDALKKRWDYNKTELVNAFKVLGYGKE